MASRADFWLHMHKLAYALDGEGGTPQERIDHVLDSFRQMPALGQREVLTDLRVLVRALSEIETRAIVVHRDATQPPPESSLLQAMSRRSAVLVRDRWLVAPS